MNSRPNSKKLVPPFLICSLLLCLAISGCKNSSDTYGGTLILAEIGEPSGLNPLTDRMTSATNIAEMLFNGLVEVKDTMEVLPDIAESWTVSENGLVWDFKLRKGVQFHDGEELTSEDVLFTYTSIRSPEIQSPLSPLYHMVDTFEAIGVYGFRVTLSRPYNPVLYLLKMEILPAHLFEAHEASLDDFSRNPIGTGPFRFASWDGEGMILEANKEYFGGRPYLDSVTVKFHTDKKSAWSELMQGKVDVVMDLDKEDFNVIQRDERFNVVSHPAIFYHTLLFNTASPLLSNKILRNAINLAIDRNDIIEDTLEGWAIETTGPFQPGTWPYNDNYPHNVTDQTNAIAILNELGWRDSNGDLILDREGKDLELSILVDKGDLLKVSVAQRIKWQLFQVGIRAEVEFLDQQQLFGERLFPGKYQTALLQFNSVGDPDTFLNLFWHSDSIGRSNLARYRNSEVDALIDRGRRMQDLDERKSVYNQIHHLLVKDVPAAFLFYRKIYISVSAVFDGLKSYSSYFYRSIKDWQHIGNHL